jgi:hypothetical protein
MTRCGVSITKLAVGTAALLSASLSSQIPDRVRDRQIGDVYLENSGIEQAVKELAYQKRLRVGLETVPGDKSIKRSVSLRLERATVGEVLDKLLAIDPRYNWREIGGMISVAPSTSDPLLDTLIRRFAIKQKSKTEALDQLFRTPELQAAFATAGVRPRSFLSIAGKVPDSDSKKFSLSFHDATVREILNRIIQEIGAPFWDYHRYGDHLEWVGISVGSS